MATQSEIQGFQQWLRDNRLSIRPTDTGALTIQRIDDKLYDLAFYRGTRMQGEVWTPVYISVSTSSPLSIADIVMQYLDDIEFDRRTDFALLDKQQQLTPLDVPFPSKTKSFRPTAFSTPKYLVDWDKYVSSPAQPSGKVTPIDLDF